MAFGDEGNRGSLEKSCVLAIGGARLWSAESLISL